ncbi:MAG: TonB-dependent receptor [Saccharospirillaceae bacterium]|nr:TonB-dependent receptor [Saccharospirillaceae bacterium]
MSSLKNRRTMKPLAATIALLAAGMTHADGSVEGRLIDAMGKTTYTDAVVRVEELNREVLTGASGRFRLPVLPAGDYTLSVIIGGEQVKQYSVVVTDGETAKATILLNDNNDSMEEILVIGQAAQIQRALDRQRFADNVVSAINADAIGQLPDSNAAEALQRVPGLSIERDQGEGRFVRVRGISPDLNAVTVNGTQLPAPEGGRRAVALDVMPSDLISSLVVTKTLTPDMDANAIGGSIEVESLSALERDGLFYSARVEASYDQHEEQTSPAYSFTAGNTFDLSEGRRLGVAGAFSYDNRKFGSDNVETGGKWKFDDGKVEGLEEMQMREYTLERERIGAALNFDLELDASNNLYLRTLYSKYTDDEQRQLSEIAFGALEDDDGEMVFEGGERMPGATGLAEAKRELKDREETQKIVSTTFGGEHFVDDWTVEYALGYSKAEEDEPGGVEAVFELDDDVVGNEYLSNIGFSNSRKPRLIASDDFYAANSYKIDEIEQQKTLVEDKQTSFKFDITRDLFIDDNPALIKFGVKSSVRKKTQDEDVRIFKDVSDESLSSYANGKVDYEFGRFGPKISPSKVRNAINGVAAEIDEEGKMLASDDEIREDIKAAYVMGRIDIEQWRILAGVRHESTKTNLQGYSITEGDDAPATAEKIEVDNDYSHTLPALHLRYQLGDATQVRAAWTNSIARPSFEQMRPGFSSNADGDEAETGNTDLKAMESANFDLGIEHFTGAAGVISAFLFHKDVDHFIFETDLAGSGKYAATDYKEVKSFRNGEQATITGLELAFSQKLDMLPSPFDGLLLSANATFSESEARIESSKEDDGAFEIITRDIQMPNQSDLTGNFTVGYEKGALMLRLAANYKSEYLLEVQDPTEKSEDIYQAAQTQLDFSSAYTINSQWKVTFDISNLTDEPYYSYQNSEQYNAQYEDYDPTYRLGVSFHNF